MKELRFNRLPLSWAHIAGAAAYGAALPLAAVDPILAMVPLILFVVLCLGAPFFPRCGLYLPVISRGRKYKRAVAITFDDGPDPAVTPLVLALLKKYGVRASFFPAGRMAERYPDLIRAILQDGHEIGNHTYRHTPLVMVQSTAALSRDIDAAQEIFIRHGVYPLAFRPPAGITNPKLWPILIPRGMYCCNFSNRAGDMGNRRIGNIAGSIIPRLKGGDVVLLHDVSPQDPGQINNLMDHFEQILRALASKGLAAIPLGRLIGRDVMVPADPTVPLRDAAVGMAAKRALALVPFKDSPSISSRTTENPGRTLVIGNPYDLPGDHPLHKMADRMEFLEFIHRFPGSAPAPGSGLQLYDSIILTSLFPAHLAGMEDFFRMIRRSLAPCGIFRCILPRPCLANFSAAFSFVMKWGLRPAFTGKRKLERILLETGFVSISMEVRGRVFALTASLGDKDTLMESLIFS